MKKTTTFFLNPVGRLLLLLFLSVPALSQTKSISGKVSSSQDNQPLQGVTVSIKGSTISTVTGADGVYRIQVPKNSRMLGFSFVGHQAQEVSIANSTVVNIVLVPSSKSLENVVVIGYGTQKQKEVTSAIASVKAEDFNQGGSRNPLDLVQGKIAGLSITRANGNNPNSGPSIQLRGVSSLRGTTTPLIVIDGIPGGNLDLIQQDDIASIDVLKDGSAAAIYGTRGNAGVVLITTKKGRPGETRFEYSGYVQREAIAKKPDFLTPDQYRNLPDRAALHPDLGGNTDIYDLLIDKKNLSQYHNFSATGGSVSSNYRASFYYNNAKGIAIRNGRKQYGARLNLNQRGLDNKLQLQTNIATNFNKSDLLGGSTGDFEQSVQRNPTAPVFGTDGKFVETNAFNNYNPLARLMQELNERDQQTFSGDVKLILEPLKNLHLSAFGSIVRNDFNDRSYRSRASRSSQQSFQGTGFASKSNNLSLDNTFETTVDYIQHVNNSHTITGLAGYSYQYSRGESFNLNNSGFSTDAFEDYNIGAGNAITNTTLPRPGLGSNKEDNKLIAFFGRINYNYREKYLLQFIMRHEGSSKFGVNNKWGNFPAVSAGWVLTSESFMKKFDFIDNLKVRVGYGITGNQDIPNYRSLILLGTGGFYLQDGVWVQTYGPSVNPNPNLRWEKKKELNIGLDFSTFNYRLNGSIDVYNRRTVDLLEDYDVPQPPFISARTFTNVGTISNKGIELFLNIIPVKNRIITWTIDFAGSRQNNTLVALSNEQYKLTFREFGGLPSPGNLGNAIRTFEGQPLGNFYGKRFAGLTQDGKWQFYKKDGSVVTTSNITNEDLTVIGNGVPKYLASLTNDIKYRNFQLTAFLRGKFKFDILNTQALYFGNKKWLPNNVLSSAINKYASLSDDPQYSDYYLEKGGFVKLDNITLAYNFKNPVKNIRYIKFYVSGRNLATFTHYSGLDPEVQDNGLTTGIDNRGFYPRTKSYTIGVNVSF